MTVLSESRWRPLADAHRDRVWPATEARRARRRRGERHPVDDFLWQYYRFSPRQLELWHPGMTITLAGAPEVAEHRDYRRNSSGWRADESVWRDPRRAQRLARSRQLLRATAARPGRFGCFGMHEWAMVHGLTQAQIRHEQVPLRLPPAQIQAVVAEVGLRCTHFDAYRFFSPTAATLQEPLTRQGQVAAEQPGCVHAGMDLYRVAYETAAFVGSDLVVACFEHARDCRTVDMRAAPYDLSDFGLEPLPMESPEGRREYVAAQQDLARRSAELRHLLISALDRLAASPVLTTADPAQSA